MSNTRLRRLLLVSLILLLAMVAATDAASPPTPASGAVVGMLLLAALPFVVAGCGSASAAEAASGAHTTADVAGDFEPCARDRGQS